MIKVLFVCLGNICRSPTSEGFFQNLLAIHKLEETIMVDSAGTGNWHIGNPPDARAQQVASSRGVDLSKLKARQVAVHDFEEFDYIIAMDRGNLDHLLSMCPSQHQSKVSLFLDYTDQFDVDEVPDPYYGGDGGFDQVLDMIESASTGLLEKIRQQHDV
ncbi:MAG: protein-tyrosine phosphatase [Gammaproteobacteria bacterium]|jgi:protein-tyrosine phosphatase